MYGMLKSKVMQDFLPANSQDVLAVFSISSVDCNECVQYYCRVLHDRNVREERENTSLYPHSSVGTLQPHQADWKEGVAVVA